MHLLLLATLSAHAGRPESVQRTDSPTHPIRCHYETQADAARCDDVLEYAELAWDIQVDDIGFAAPPADHGEGGSDDLDIYLTLDGGGAGSAWAMCDWQDGGCLDTDPDDGWASAPSWLAIDSATPDEDLPSFVVHEFNHACHYAMDYAEPFLVVWEASAVAAEHWSWPDWNPSSSDIADYQATPWVSAVLQDGYMLWDDYGAWSYYEYGSVIWLWWLDHSYGDGMGSVAPELWTEMTQEGYRYEPDLLDAWQAISGDWRTSLLAFTAERARMGGPNGPAWLEFAGEQARAARAETDVELPSELEPQMPPFPLGAVFYDLSVEEGAMVDLSLEDLDDEDWALVVVEPGAQQLTRGTEARYGPTQSQTITVAVVNLGPPELDADDRLQPASFTLRAREARCGCASQATARGMGLWGLLGLLLAAAGRRRD